ncbi:histidinol-phosphate transaminase [Vibrio sp.]|uniref:histidinol-phosphate transaminase n=1 Tax=Vibrio sp. TaxID=678 RepID=UPI003D0BF119
MPSLASQLAPESIKKLIPYQSARRIGGNGRLWLNANELEMAISFDGDEAGYNRYPDFLPHDIAKAYQNYCQTDAEVMAVRGADEAIDLLVRTFCQPGQDNILICSPTYAMYNFCADAFGVGTIDVPLLKPNFALDVDNIAQQSQKAKLVFLCSPNNPTGNAIPQPQIIELLERTQQHALVVVDEAYIEFDSGESAVSLLERYPNLVVIRTLSKAFGLAAVRCGFIVAASEVLEFVAKLVPPYPMPDCSARIVLSALSAQGLDTVKSSTETIIATRDKFIEDIRQLSWLEQVYPSATNFVLVKTTADVDLFQYLMSHGIVTRNQGHEPSLTHCVRITIGSPATMQEVTELLLNYPNNKC